MSKGFVIHAYNNEEIDYGTMAMASAALIKKNMMIKTVALISSQDTIGWMERQHGSAKIRKLFDEIILVDRDGHAAMRTMHDTRYSSKTQPYFNTNRASAYHLSPFDETVLIDADYLILDNSLDSVWGCQEDLLVNRSVTDLRHNISPSGFDSRFNEMSIPLYWATLMYFRRSSRCKTLFDLISFIRENYSYYQGLYQFPPGAYFRNDYALSIALHMINGQIENDGVKNLPNGSLLTATEYDDMIDFRDGVAYFIGEHEQGDFTLHRVLTNVHVMNKWSVNRMSGKILSYAGY